MKDTLKTLELLEQHIDRVVENGLYEIERDLLLERMRGIYATIATAEVTTEATTDVTTAVATAAVVAEEPIVQEEQEEQIVQEEQEVQEQPEMQEELVEERCVEPTDSEEIDHEAVMSLYDEDELPVVENKEEFSAIAEDAEDMHLEEDVTKEQELALSEENESTVEEENESIASEGQSVVLGDILATEQTTVADNLAEQMVADVATTGANISLRSSIALNDKFILMRDLFAGNNDYYEMAINHLDSFDNLEDAMLYIHDNFHWNPNSEGARLLMELLARKLF